MLLPGGQKAADLHQEYSSLFFRDLIFPLLRRQPGITVLQLLGGHKGNLLRQDALDIIIFICHPFFCHAQRGINGLHHCLQRLLISLLLRNDLFPVPLIHINGVDIIGILIPADGVHIGIKTLAGQETISAKSHPLPFCQRMNDLHMAVALLFDPK